MNKQNKKALYESIMKSVAKTVKHQLNESEITNIDVPVLEPFLKDLVKGDNENILLHAGKLVAHLMIVNNNLKLENNEELLTLMHDAVEEVYNKNNKLNLTSIVMEMAKFNSVEPSDINFIVNSKNIFDYFSRYNLGKSDLEHNYFLYGFLYQLLMEYKPLVDKLSQYINEFK